MRASGLGAMSVEVGVRAAVAVAVPLLLLLAVGRLDLAAYVTFGAFTALYGRNEPYRLRIRSVTIAGTGMLTAIALGVGVAVLGNPLALRAAVLVVLVAAGTVVAAAFQLLPAQPLFFVFALLVCSALPTPAAAALPRIALAASVAAFAWLLTMSGWTVRRILRNRFDRAARSPVLLKELRRRPSVDCGALRDPRIWLTVAQNVVGVLIAGGIARLFGLGHAYWALVSVVAVIPPARAAHSISRSLHRIAGTIAGVIVTAAVLVWSPPPLVVIVVIVVCQFFAEILVGRHYGWALVFVTPMALSVSHLASLAPLGVLVVDRVFETVLGAAVGIALVLLARGVESRIGTAS